MKERDKLPSAVVSFEAHCDGRGEGGEYPFKKCDVRMRHRFSARGNLINCFAG